MARPHRDTIFVEDATVLAVEHFPGAQFVLRLRSPECAARATAGSFAHVRCDDAIPMRRPLSIMRANTAEGWIEVLFKIVERVSKRWARKLPATRSAYLAL